MSKELDPGLDAPAFENEKRRHAVRAPAMAAWDKRGAETSGAQGEECGPVAVWDAWPLQSLLGGNQKRARDRARFRQIPARSKDQIHSGAKYGATLSPPPTTTCANSVVGSLHRRQCSALATAPSPDIVPNPSHSAGPPSASLTSSRMLGAGALDTQNQRWASDKTKFGYRMLEKMGWREGKGLGAQEDGSTENVRVRKRLTTAGIGADAQRNKAWDVPGQVAAGLNDVLASLQPVTANDGRESKNEERKKDRKARGYYERRRQHKNVSNYSQKDLAEIFGGAACATKPQMEQESLGEGCVEQEVEDREALVKREVKARDEPLGEANVARTVKVKKEPLDTRNVRVKEEPMGEAETTCKLRVKKEPVDDEAPTRSVKVKKESVDNERPKRRKKVKEEPVDEASTRKTKVQTEPVDSEAQTRKLKVKKEPVDDEATARRVKVKKEPVDDEAPKRRKRVKEEEEPVDEAQTRKTKVKKEPVDSEAQTRKVKVKKEPLDDEAQTHKMQVKIEPMDDKAPKRRKRAKEELVDDEAQTRKFRVKEEPMEDAEPAREVTVKEEPMDVEPVTRNIVMKEPTLVAVQREVWVKQEVAVEDRKREERERRERKKMRKKERREKREKKARKAGFKTEVRKLEKKDRKAKKEKSKR